MEAFEIRSLSFAYPGQRENAIEDISLSIHAGEFIVVFGPSGSGKSTLLRQLKPELAPHGVKSGEILFEGKAIEDLSRREQAQRIGFVFQNPEDQIVTDKVWHELAFGMENLGYDSGIIRRAVAEMASFFGMEDWFHKDVSELSGGQKQLLNLASVMTMQPSVLILDEPTGQLDPIAAANFLSAIERINRELGTTVILTEHRLEEVLPMADRAVVLDGGRVEAVGTPREVGLKLKEKGSKLFLSMPVAMRVWASVESGSECPLTVREGKRWLQEYSAGHEVIKLPDIIERSYPPEPALEAKELWYRYEKSQPDVIKGLSLMVKKGEILAILGGNGAGKTTLLKLLAGIYAPQRGEIRASGRVGLLPQNPQTLFVGKTVRQDLEKIFKSKPLPESEIKEKLERVSELCRLGNLLERHPYDLSGGEQQRAALAKVLLTEPDIILLDEPTKGLDAAFARSLAGILDELTKQGSTVIIVSHDVEFCARFSHRCAMLFDGCIIADAEPHKFFSGGSFYTSAANRMARGLIPEAVTAEELIYAVGGEETFSEVPEKTTEPIETPENEPQSADGSARIVTAKRRLGARTKLSCALVLLLIPLTLFVGAYYLDGRKYYFISLLILLEMMLPFFIAFEGRKPQARELVTIAVLCAIGVAGRAALFMLPQFKPVMAITIIAGAALGAESGFLVGSMTMLVSNIMFGQGPWTPWQMFAMGISGFLAGLVFRRGRSRGSLCVFGALCALIIYGGIVNPASALIWTHTLEWKTVLAYYISGFPMDCVHAAATWIILWFIAEPMLDKLDRIKIKYGFDE